MGVGVRLRGRCDGVRRCRGSGIGFSSLLTPDTWHPTPVLTDTRHLHSLLRFAVPIAGDRKITALTKVEDKVTSAVATGIGVVQDHRSNARIEDPDGVYAVPIPITRQRHRTK